MSSSIQVNNKKSTFNSGKRSNRRVRANINYRKSVFHYFYCDKKEILLKLALQ